MNQSKHTKKVASAQEVMAAAEAAGPIALTAAEIGDVWKVLLVAKRNLINVAELFALGQIVERIEQHLHLGDISFYDE